MYSGRVDPQIELLIAEIELHVNWCRTQRIRVGLVNMADEEALSCDGKWQQQWLEVAESLISSQTRVLGGLRQRVCEVPVVTGCVSEVGIATFLTSL